MARTRRADRTVLANGMEVKWRRAATAAVTRGKKCTERKSSTPAMVAGRLWWMSQDAQHARAHVRGPIRRLKAANPMAATVFQVFATHPPLLRRYKLRAAFSPSFSLPPSPPSLFLTLSLEFLFDLFIHLFNSVFLVSASGIARRE